MAVDGRCSTESTTAIEEARFLRKFFRFADEEEVDVEAVAAGAVVFVHPRECFDCSISGLMVVCLD